MMRALWLTSNHVKTARVMIEKTMIICRVHWYWITEDLLLIIENFEEEFLIIQLGLGIC